MYKIPKKKLKRKTLAGERPTPPNALKKFKRKKSSDPGWCGLVD